MGVEGETFLLTRYCFGLISLGIYALRLCLVCVVDVRVHPRSSVGILEGALDLTADLCKALFLHGSGALRSSTELPTPFSADPCCSVLRTPSKVKLRSFVLSSWVLALGPC